MEGSTLQGGDAVPMQRHVLATLAIAILLLAISGFVVAGRAEAQATDQDEFVDGEVVVKLNKATGTTVQGIYGAYPEVDPARTETYLASSGIYLLGLREPSDTAGVVERMRGDSARFVYAEFNYTIDAPEGDRSMRFRGDSTPAPHSDPTLYRDQYAVGALNLSQAHRANGGAGSTVAVLDTGAQLDHPELAGSLVPGYDFIGDDGDPSEEPNGVDDDNDCPGADCSYPFVDEATGHGTHVAGIVHLTAPDAKIMPLRVLDSDGRGNVFVIAEAIQRAVDPDGDPRTDDGADVINMSLGTPQRSNLIQDVSDDLDALEGDDDDETGSALRGVPTRGVVVVGSAGNEGAEQLNYPSAEVGVIGVASVGEDETKSDFSNFFGSPEVDVSVPGDDIHSTFTGGRYAEWDGTSMAAPFVAGQAALIRSMRPGLPSTAPQGRPSVSELITTTARSIEEANKNTNWAGKLGAGHADVLASLVEANTAPEISAVLPDGATRDRTPLISAAVRDTQTNLAGDDLSLFVDGRRIDAFSYNADTDRLTRLSGRLPYGRHSVRLTATDALDASTTRTWRFRVVR